MASRPTVASARVAVTLDERGKVDACTSYHVVPAGAPQRLSVLYGGNGCEGGANYDKYIVPGDSQRRGRSPQRSSAARATPSLPLLARQPPPPCRARRLAALTAPR